MPIALVALEFDPVLRLGGTAIRFETLALAATVLGSLMLAAGIARAPLLRRLVRTPGEIRDLRPDDLVLLVLAVVPGAVAGGRFGYALVHLDYYGAHPAAILDPGRGGLELSFAVLGGALTGAFAARLVGEPVGRWLHVATLPLLVGLAAGKLAMALGGRGQGSPSELPWATSYLGGGPWGSLGPSIPSHPSQIYEAIATILVLIVVAAFIGRGLVGRPEGIVFAVGLGGWALARAVVAATWRDAPVLGPLLAEQLICLAIVAGCLAAVSLVIWPRSLLGRQLAPAAAEPEAEVRPPA